MSLSAATAGLRRFLPKGSALPEDLWNQRHRVVVVLLWAAGLGLPIFGAIRGYGLVHSRLEGAVVAAIAVAAAWAPLRRRWRASIGTSA